MKSNRLQITACFLLVSIIYNFSIEPQTVIAQDVKSQTFETAVDPLDSLQEKANSSLANSLVHIETELGGANGFCLRKKDGSKVIVTCYRGIAGAKSAKVLLAKGDSFSVDKCLAYDAGKDLLILEVPNDQPLKALSLVSEDKENRAVTSHLTHTRGSAALFGKLQFSSEKGKVQKLSTNNFWKKINDGLNSKASPKAKDECKQLALSPKVKWLLTDICVRKENRGNPLIDFSGCVIGMNSWSKIEGKFESNQSLLPSEIKTLLEEAPSKISLSKLEAFPVILAGSKYVSSVKWLPTRKLQSISPTSRNTAKTNYMRSRSSSMLQKGADVEKPKFADRHNIKFYSGAEVTLNCSQEWNAMLDVFDNYEKAFFGARLNRNGKIEGLAGGTLARADNLCFLGFYKNGMREGAFYVWQKDNIPVMQFQFSEDERNGYCCYLHEIEHKDDKAVACLFAVEYQKGVMKRIHHFSNNGDEVLASYDSVDAMKASPNTLKQWESLTSIEKDLKSAEFALKRQARKVVESAKKSKAAAVNLGKREATINRINSRRNLNQQKMKDVQKQQIEYMKKLYK
jgi:hypothetical protein